MNVGQFWRRTSASLPSPRLQSRYTGFRRHQGKQNSDTSGGAQEGSSPGCSKRQARCSMAARVIRSIRVVVGYIYMMKLGHWWRTNSRARGRPYSSSRNNSRGKAQYGGQRFGEMEVWALEATVRLTPCRIAHGESDDVQGARASTSPSSKVIIRWKLAPESFNVLIKEMQSLGLDVKVGGQPRVVFRQRG